jgi:hypothetical protein
MSSAARLGLILALCAVGGGLEGQVFTKGLWVGAGGGLARFSATCDWCGDRMVEDGGLGTFSVTYTLGARVRASVEVAGWFGVGGSVEERQGSVTGVVQVRPLAGLPFFAEGGAGLTKFQNSFGPGADAPVLKGQAGALRLGAGAEFLLDRGLVIVPRVTWSASGDGEITPEQGGDAGPFPIRYSVVAVGVSVFTRLIPP